MNRRRFIAAAAAAAAALPIGGRAASTAKVVARVVVVGGGFAGASCARALRRLAPGLEVTLVEPSETFTACPGTNSVIAGLRELPSQQFRYEALRRDGIALVRASATAVDPAKRLVAASDGTRLAYDRLVVGPGVEMRWNALRGYDEAAAARMPHAWQAGEQTLLLRRQLEAMPDGGLVAIAVPAYPYRCPSAPYERASLIAHYLKTRKPRSKLVILDAKDGFSQQRLFEQAWQELYPNLIEWTALSQGGGVTAVDAASGTLETDFDKHRPAVANVIPPQKAGRIADAAGVTDATGWCAVDPLTFESKREPRIHVIGDAAIAGALPKSATGARSQGLACARAVVALLAERAPEAQTLANSCYSLVGPDYGISQSGTYHAANGQLVEMAGSGRISELGAPRAERAADARRADAWLADITRETFG